MIRLARIGKKKQPFYRLVVSEKARDMYGKALEILGHYNPRSKETEIKADRVKYWISKGAQSSATVHNLLVSNKIIEEKKQSVTNISKKRAEKAKKKEAPKKEESAEKPAEAKEEPKTESTSAEASADKEKTKPAEEAKPATENKAEETKEEPKTEDKKEE